MKKAFIYIITLLLVTIVTVSGTYALFTVMASGNNAINEVGTHQLKVIYSGDTAISGEIELVESKEKGFRRVVSIALGEDSTPAVANLYIALEHIDVGLASEAMNWELYELNGKEETYVDSGTLLGYESGQKVYMLKGLELTTTTKEYAIYLWLNGHKAGNEVKDAALRGFIGAETEPITGITS